MQATGSQPARTAPRRAGDWVLGLVATEADLLRLAPEWDALLAASPRPSPFLSWRWVYTWWQFFGPGTELAVHTVRDRQGRLLGLAPLHLVHRRSGLAWVRSLEFLGYRGDMVCADHLDFLSRREHRGGILTALLGAVQRQPDWDVIVLADLDEASLLPGLWPASGPAGPLEQATGEVCSFLPLPASTAELWQDVARRHPEFARNVGRYRRRLDRHHDHHFVVPVPGGELAATVAALQQLHAQSRARQRGTSNFTHAGYRGFHEALIPRLMESGNLYLARLDCAGHAVAAFYGFVQGDVLYYYKSGFDTAMGRDGIGKLLLAHVLEDAINRLRLREFDFLRGDEAYKRLWTDRVRHTSTWLGWRPRARARLHRLQWHLRRRLAAARGWSGRTGQSS